MGGAAATQGPSLPAGAKLTAGATAKMHRRSRSGIVRLSSLTPLRALRSLLFFAFLLCVLLPAARLSVKGSMSC